jgi:hypothetical protein
MSERFKSAAQNRERDGVVINSENFHGEEHWNLPRGPRNSQRSSKTSRRRTKVVILCCH